MHGFECETEQQSCMCLKMEVTKICSKCRRLIFGNKTDSERVSCMYISVNLLYLHSSDPHL